MTLNSGSNATAVLTAAANGTTMTGTYTVLNGHSNADLAIASYAITSPVTDLYGNVMTVEIGDLPSNSNLNGVTLDVDGAPPASTITSAAYNDSANTITLTGTKFNEIDGYQNGSGVAQDIKAQLDWTKLSGTLTGTVMQLTAMQRLTLSPLLAQVISFQLSLRAQLNWSSH